MNLKIKETFEKVVKEADSLFDEFKRRDIDLSNSKRIFSESEIERRRKALRDEYITKAENFYETKKGTPDKAMNDAINLLMPSSQKRENNLLWLNIDITTLANAVYRDKEAFSIVQKYFGDLDIMKRFAMLPNIYNYKSATSTKNTNTTASVLNLAFTLEDLAKQYAEEFEKYIRLLPVSVTNSGVSRDYIGASATSNNNMRRLLIERNILKLISYIEDTILKIEQAKNCTFEYAKSNITSVLESLRIQTNSEKITSKNESIKEDGDLSYTASGLNLPSIDY